MTELQQQPLPLQGERALSATLWAPAKINFCLEVRGRRPDGYHELATVMMPLSLADRVALAQSDKLTVTCPGLDIPGGEENIALRAARRFFEAVGLPEGARITIKKQIPAEAGLGGGSADAAAVLRGLQALYGGPDDGALRDLAVGLGADVPFCLRGHPALCTGIGETLRCIPAPALALVLAKGPEGLSTPEVFGRYDGLSAGEREGILQKLVEEHPNLNNLKSKYAEFKHKTADETARDLFDGSTAELRGLLRNDLLAPALSLRPGVGATLDALCAGEPLAVGMSGAGTACFAFCRDAAHAEAVRRQALAACPGLALCLCVSANPAPVDPFA